MSYPSHAERLRNIAKDLGPHSDFEAVSVGLLNIARELDKPRGFCTLTQGCRFADGHNGGCERS